MQTLFIKAQAFHILFFLTGTHDFSQDESQDSPFVIKSLQHCKHKQWQIQTFFHFVNTSEHYVNTMWIGSDLYILSE